MSAPDLKQVEQTLQNKIVFSFLRYLSELSKSNTEGLDSDSLEVAVQCLSEAFNINLNNEDHKQSYDIEPSITTVFKYGLAVASGSNPMVALVKKALDANIAAAAQPKVPEKTEQDYFEEKFQQYLEHLKEKEYFAGTEPGSEEYNQRVAKARARLETEEKAAEAIRLEQAEQKKQLGNELLQQKKIDEAIAAYNEAIHLNPKSAIFYANRAAAYSQLKRHDKAIEDCHAALKVDPNYIKAYSRLGLAYFSLEKYEDSVKSYEKAVLIEPENESLKQSLAVARKKLATVAPAAAHQHSPSCSHSHGEHGHSHGEHGHSHAGAAGMPDFSSILNNPAMQNMINTFQQSAGDRPANLSDVLNNPQLMQQAGEMLNNPEMAGLFNNPNVMNMAANMMKNPDMMNMLGGLMGRRPPQ